MKLKDGFITHDSGGEQIMVAVGDAAYKFHGLVRSNKTASFIIDCLKQENTEAEIVDAILEEFKASSDVVTKDVHNIIAILRQVGAINE